jgi:hypothetical protein
VEWPAGLPVVELGLEAAADGRTWFPVAVDGNPPVPFLLQASAGAIALTGARASGFGPVGAGSLTLRDELLPGIRGGLLIKQRRLALGALVLGNQSLLLVTPEAWPHGLPRGGAAGVLGYDLFRRFVVELDAGNGRLALYRQGRLDVGRMPEVRRLIVLDRTPYFEVSITQGSSPERWVRLQFEPAAPVGICLDADPGPGVALFAGHAVEIEAAPCPATEAAPLRGARDGVFGAGALRELVVSVDYDARAHRLPPARLMPRRRAN